ncbi:nuclear transport factor 2 family protein [Stenotrophomonas mori]|uniref:Nuclear transport factor 2 family protein n=1 Tax=Stenotrophomonas mori TaxID=2871096 RepID=A0ABT0SKU0_9GAMM|nr:nuclear transport factor 2 family protein [Stenotrophomonas mori]MCL7715595.1 nuclear transport factor 2 family protein [Stenotrophomonas mori]
MQIDPSRFAAAWAAAWNGHDVDAVLAHFHDEAVFTSPFARQVLPDTGGVLRGKAAIRTYWSAGLARIPDLHFDIEAVYAGVDTLVIAYRNQKGVLVSEVLRFAGDRVIEGHGTYPLQADNPTGARSQR